MSASDLKLKQDYVLENFNNVRSIYIDFVFSNFFIRRGGCVTSFNLVSQQVDRDNNDISSVSTNIETPIHILKMMRQEMNSEHFANMMITLSGNAVRSNALSEIFPILALQRSDDSQATKTIGRIHLLKNKHYNSSLNLKLTGSDYNPQ